jgi:hypothetical protein
LVRHHRGKIEAVARALLKGPLTSKMIDELTTQPDG